MRITVFDTSIATKNLGDELIMESVVSRLNELLDYPRMYHIPTHDEINEGSYKCLQDSSISFVGGTNLLSSNMREYKQWHIGLRDAWKLNNVVLFGVGWWQYQEKPSWYTKFLLRRVLSDDYNHSVRDSYTKNMLESIGISNVINTGCPTMWNLTGDHCNVISESKAKDVVFTLTDYNRNEIKDKKMIQTLRDEYDSVHFWPQGAGDREYFQYLFPDHNVNIIKPTVSAYTSFLSSQSSLDYVGTRLHGGIHALNHQVRTIIVGIDNRAIEKGEDFNLKVVNRDNIEHLSKHINEKSETNLNIPHNRINRWKSQFTK